MQSASSTGVALGQVRASISARVTYRPDIDGLRAISVLAVILFHAKVPGFAGGYIGVDVFFVISGYLIAQVLIASPERNLAGKVRNFYARRCRRILPALLAMLLATVPVACLLFLPPDLSRFGTCLGATSIFLGNVVEWRSGGYFEPESPFNPLAHLWSLAVEEQFYIVFPLVFLTSGKARGGRQLVLIAGCALASLALCVWGSYAHPRANFFLAPTRAWELLLGSLVALGVGRSLSTHPWRGVASRAALIALVGCVVGYDGRLPYPGIYALVPCASAALLIAAGAGVRGTHVDRWLGTPALVFVGMISYSLYLWHLPILSFASYYNIFPLGPRHVGLLLALIFAIATVSWRYVEAPIRGRAVFASDARFLGIAGAATLAVASLGALLTQFADRAERSDAANGTVISTMDRLRSDAVACGGRTLSEIAKGFACTFGPASGAKAEVLVWGDSHATALLPAYEQIAFARDVRIHAAVHSSCPPLLRAPNASDRRARRECGDFNTAVVNSLGTIDPALVILNAYWTHPDGALDAPRNFDDAGDVQAFEASLDATLRAIGAQRKVCVIGDVPSLRYRMPYAYIMARRRGIDPALVALPSDEADRQLGRVKTYLEELHLRHALRFVDLAKTLCTGSACALLSADGQMLYRDNNHLSVAGAELVRPTVDSCFDGLD